MRAVGSILLASVLCALALHADEAVRSDGRTAQGTLRLEKTGKLLFTPATALKAIAPEELSEVRFDTEGPLFRGAPSHLLHLPNDQQITGVFLGLQENQLLLRTAWAERLSVPRSAAIALTHLPGWQPVIVEDFRGKLSAWTVRGAPATAEGTVVLAKPGQSLACNLPSLLDAGRIGLNFREEEATAGARWSVEAVFGLKSGERVVRASLAGEKHLTVNAGGLDGTMQRVERVPGWRRLRFDFGPGSLRITCDESVLWYTLAKGPGGLLRQVRLVCTEAARLRPCGVAWRSATSSWSAPHRSDAGRGANRTRTSYGWRVATRSSVKCCAPTARASN